MKLYYSHNLNPRVAVAVARYLGSPVEYVRARPRDPAQEEAFRPINPNTLVPVLTDGDLRLWETDAIACLLSQQAGSDFWRQGEGLPSMIMWVSWGTHHLTSAASVMYWEYVIRPTFSDAPPAPGVIEEGMADFRRHAAVLDAALAGRTWLVGDEVSYADFRVATSLPFAAGARLPVDEFTNVSRWHERLCQIDAWRAPFDGLE